MSGRDIIVVGSSAGGIETLKRLLAELPADLPASIFIAQHLSPESPALLSKILDRAGELPVEFAEDGKRFERQHVYVAPPDRHLLIEDGSMRVVRGPRENRYRPAIDPLFRSAAVTHGRRVVGVVLSGMLDDGAAGLWAVRSHGGVSVVQDPAEALYPDMPHSALRLMEVHYCLTLTGIAQLLTRLATQPLEETEPQAPQTKAKIETEFAMADGDFEAMRTLGTPSSYSCPTCGGSLWEIREGAMMRFRCHIGHSFQIPSLLVEQNRAIESALEAAQRALEEKAAVLRRVANQLNERLTKSGDTFEERARAADESALAVRDLLERMRE